MRTQLTIKSVLFDFDGTLADTLPLSFKAFRSVFLKYENKLLTDKEIIDTFGPTEEEIIGKNIFNKDLVNEAIEYYYVIFEKHFRLVLFIG
ncbi:hypothetical protein PMSD_04815 [Paenibacillus macquariensis subsp. defensor]|nr:hypothetical protein PMSD_04815 [Paenibacillus macquariensis subsp. defensor]